MKKPSTDIRSSKEEWLDKEDGHDHPITWDEVEEYLSYIKKKDSSRSIAGDAGVL